MAPGLRGFFGEESSCDGEFLHLLNTYYFSAAKCECGIQPFLCTVGSAIIIIIIVLRSN